MTKTFVPVCSEGPFQPTNTPVTLRSPAVVSAAENHFIHSKRHTEITGLLLPCSPQHIYRDIYYKTQDRDKTETKPSGLQPTQVIMSD